MCSIDVLTFKKNCVFAKIRRFIFFYFHVFIKIKSINLSTSVLWGKWITHLILKFNEQYYFDWLETNSQCTALGKFLILIFYRLCFWSIFIAKILETLAVSEFLIFFINFLLTYETSYCSLFLDRDGNNNGSHCQFK